MLQTLKQKTYRYFGLAALASSLLTSTLANANIIQYFGFQTENPALLQLIQENELQVGAAWTVPYICRSGKVPPNFRGKTKAHKDIWLAFPKFRYASRICDKIVVGLDVYEPVYSLYPWRKDAFTATAGTEVFINSTSFAPKISVSVTDKLTVGLAYVGTDIWNRSGFLSPAGYFDFHGMGWANSFNVGAMYQCDEKTVIDFTYLYKIKTSLHGESFVGSTVNTHTRLRSYTWSPDTFALKLLRFMTDKWIALLEVDYSLWDVQKEYVIENSALGGIDLAFPNKWKNVWRFHIFNRYQFCEKWAGFLSVAYETKPIKPVNDLVIFPSSDWLTSVLGIDYSLSEGMLATVFLGVTSWPSKSIQKYPPGSKVRTKANYPFFGLNFKYNWSCEKKKSS